MFLSLRQETPKTTHLHIRLEDGVIVGDTDLKKYITNYYKNLFGQSDDKKKNAGRIQLDDLPQVKELKNELKILQ